VRGSCTPPFSNLSVFTVLTPHLQILGTALDRIPPSPSLYLPTGAGVCFITFWREARHLPNGAEY